MTDKNRNLIVRVLTVVVLLPGVLWLIWRGGLPFALLIAAATALCALELNQLAQREISGAALASVGGAFLIPLILEAPLGAIGAPAILTGVVMLALTYALLL